ncbi:MAG: glucosaminidase domain-containing protein, partial [Prevotella sp.]|nr:glucosaminidase domain-containing protein [Prevotella sp.]
MATKKQVEDFIKRIAPIAQEKASGRAKWSLPSVCIAQCCCESAYGTSPKMMNANAILGIKVGKSKVHFGTAWKDKAYSTQTKECYDGKTYVNITDMFRAYDDISNAIEDYYDMLAFCSRYRGCINQADPKTCITAIKNGGYATSPTYVNTIMSIINKYNLMQFDSVIIKSAAAGITVTAAHNPYKEPMQNIRCGT